MNVQLYAYEGTTRYELDLYPEQPIKITLSAEEITDPTRVNSTFSRQFRIPATTRNSQFFKYWYTSGVLDFDVTKKVNADIYVDGIRYTNGQLRLIAAYQNDTSDRIDFEVVFLGETKTFSSQVGDNYMSSIDAIDAAHVLTLPYLENSWNEVWDPTVTYQVGQYVWWSAASYGNPAIGDSYKALAVNTNSEPSLSNSNWQRMTTTQRVPNPEPVRYILADRGYDYDDDGKIVPVPGATDSSAISVDNSAGNGFPETHNYAFTKVGNPLFLTQFTPIVQVKYLIDKIFEGTSYSYTADSAFNEDWFKKLYVDGIATAFPYTPSGNGQFFARTLYQQLNPASFGDIIFPIVEQNNANAYSVTTGKYTIPVGGTYTFRHEGRGRVNYGGQGIPASVTATIFRNGSSIVQATDSEPVGSIGDLFFAFEDFNALEYSGNFNTGDEVWVNYQYEGAGAYILTGNFSSTVTPSQIAVNDLLKTDLKIIDFFRSILTKFRMVMVPTVEDPSTFRIQPWQDYIGSGETFDWTYKLDHNRDIKMEPLFYDQQADITFIDQEDTDAVNTYQQNTFGQPFGTRRFVSGNELLSGTREITTEFAPTPVNQIVGLAQVNSQFIIPKFYENGDELDFYDNRLQHLPIEPTQRLLFWNGLQPTTTTTSVQANQQITWHYTDGVTDKTSNQEPLLYQGFKRYPRASYLTEIPTIATTLNLNWNKQYAYYTYPGTTETGQNGQDVYQRYWKTYIDNNYSAQARKMTAYFNLDSQDLRRLTFDDVIFIKDTYWRIQKVYDAPLGEIATVKVELIKILQYVPPIGSASVLDATDYNEVFDPGSESNTAFAVANPDQSAPNYTAPSDPNPEDIQPAP